MSELRCYCRKWFWALSPVLGDMPFLDGLAFYVSGAPLIAVNFDWAVPYDLYLMLWRPWNKWWAALLYQGFARRSIMGLNGEVSTDVMLPATYWLLPFFDALLPEDSMIIPVQLHLQCNFKRCYNQSGLLVDKYSKLGNFDILISYRDALLI